MLTTFFPSYLLHKLEHSTMLRIPPFFNPHPSTPRTTRTSSLTRAPGASTMGFVVLNVLAIAALVLASALIRRSDSAETCLTVDQPNPIADLYPNSATGVLNGTMAIIPITLEAARQIIPEQFTILEGALRAAMPSFPEGMYPVLAQAMHDHDIQFRAYNMSIPDFSRAGFEFPFLDLLGDGYSSFRWAPTQMLLATNEMAVQGSEAYGTQVFPSDFNPGCEAYQAYPNGGSTFTAFTLPDADPAKARYLNLDFLTATGDVPFPLDYYRNITNQPVFAAEGKTCDNMIRLFNTTLSQGQFEPVPVKGKVDARLEPWTEGKVFGDIYGYRVATPFIENNYLDCMSLQGYQGTGGSGD